MTCDEFVKLGKLNSLTFLLSLRFLVKRNNDLKDKIIER